MLAVPDVAPDEANEHFQGRGPPGAIRTEEAIDLAAPHAHVDAVDALCLGHAEARPMPGS